VVHIKHLIVHHGIFTSIDNFTCCDKIVLTIYIKRLIPVDLVLTVVLNSSNYIDNSYIYALVYHDIIHKDSECFFIK